MLSIKLCSSYAEYVKKLYASLPTIKSAAGTIKIYEVHFQATIDGVAVTVKNASTVDQPHKLTLTTMVSNTPDGNSGFIKKGNDGSDKGG